jgi:hypothetical protein
VENGLAILTLGPGTFQVDTIVAFPKNVVLKTSTTMVSLMGAEDAPFPATTGPVTLSWEKAKVSEHADFWEVTLYTVVGSMITKKRIYTTTTPEVKIQGVDLPTGRYLLKISGFTGRPGAATGDFRTVQGSQAMSVIHPRTFVVQ